MSILSAEEARRYQRHLVLRDIGGAGQQKLKVARVLVIGAGGLGSPAIAYLAAAGVGTIGIVDDDAVSLSNLQRQILHRTADVGTRKTESAARFVMGLNDNTTVVLQTVRLTEANADALMAGFDLVLDGSDSFDTRKIVADAADRAGLPVVSGAVSMWDGQVTVFAPGTNAFARLWPVAPTAEDVPSCQAVGVLGALTGTIGTLMAMEAIKLITGAGEPLTGRLLVYDGRAARFTEILY